MTELFFIEDVYKTKYFDLLYLVDNTRSQLQKINSLGEILEVLSVNFKINEIYKIGNSILITDTSNGGYILEEKVLHKIDGFTLDSICEDLGLAVTTLWESFNPVSIRNYLCDIKLSVIKWEVLCSNLRFEKNLLICLGSLSLEIYSTSFNHREILFRLDNSKYNWTELNYKNELVENQAEIRRIIGVYNNVLWLGLNSGRLLGLDANNGIEKFEVSSINQYFGARNLFEHYGPELMHRKDWGLYLLQYAQLDEKNGVLFGLRNYYYFEIDLSNPEKSFSVYDACDSFQNHNIEADMANSYEWAWEEKEIFFGHNFTAGNNLGTFHRGLKRVTWATRLQQDNGQARNISKIDFGADRLYVLDQQRTLHIFGRDLQTQSTESM